MQPKDVFGIVVRTIGLLESLYGIWFLAYAVAQYAGASEETWPTGDYVITGGLWFVLGAALLLGAGLVERIAYR
jgi:hypothetical protein